MQSLEHPKDIVSIIILNYNGAEFISDCLNSLIVQDYQSLEIIVIDNNSTDNSEDVVKNYNDVIWYRMDKNYGYSKGNNAGAKIALGKYLFFINNDMRFPQHCVSTLVDNIREESEIFALDIKQLDWDGGKNVHASQRLKKSKLFFGNFIPSHNIVDVECEEKCDVPFSSGANLFCRKDVFEKLNGFDENFFVDYEDTDLCWRAWMLGFRTVFIPNLMCNHKVGETFKLRKKEQRNIHAKSIENIRCYSRNRNYFRWILKTMPVTLCIMAFFQLHIKAVGYIVIKMDFIKFSLCLRSIWSNIWGIETILQERKFIFNGSVWSSQRVIQMLCN